MTRTVETDWGGKASVTPSQFGDKTGVHLVIDRTIFGDPSPAKEITLSMKARIQLAEILLEGIPGRDNGR